MFTDFNLKIEEDTNNILNEYYDAGKELYNKYDNRVKNELKSYIYRDRQNLDGTQIQNEWFPQVKTDIFLSHSHKDERQVINLAGWLHEKFRITSFIDSCIWGYANDLLRYIDDKFSIMHENSEGKTYYYDKCAISASHVHMMLSMALFKMIDKTECLFFVNTPSSINVVNSIKESDTTLSPWIYAEIEMSNLVRKRRLSEYRKKAKYVLENKNNLQMRYDVSLKHLVDLNISDLLDWEKKNNYEYALDYLYMKKGLLKWKIN